MGRRRTYIIPAGLSLLLLAAILTGCAATVLKPTEQNFETPSVTLSSVEVEHYWGWWYFSDELKTYLGTKDIKGAPLDLAFIFRIENPNPFPVKMENFKFTIAFEEFDLNTVFSREIQWIPAGKSKKYIFSKWEPTGMHNQVRVHAMFDGRQSMMNLRETGGFKLNDKGMGAGTQGALKQLEAWWKGIPDFTFPIYVKEGSAVFKVNGFTKVAAFNGTFPR